MLKLLKLRAETQLTAATLNLSYRSRSQAKRTSFGRLAALGDDIFRLIIGGFTRITTTWFVLCGLTFENLEKFNLWIFDDENGFATRRGRRLRKIAGKRFGSALNVGRSVLTWIGSHNLEPLKVKLVELQ